MKDHYAVLGIARYCDEKAIKKAYRQMAMRYHPDRNPGQLSKFKEVQAAYDVLSGANRGQYDKELKATEQPKQNQYPPGYGGASGPTPGQAPPKANKQQPRQSSPYGTAWGYYNVGSDPNDDWRARYAEARRQEFELERLRRQADYDARAEALKREQAERQRYHEDQLKMRREEAERRIQERAREAERARDEAADRWRIDFEERTRHADADKAAWESIHNYQSPPYQTPPTTTQDDLKSSLDDLTKSYNKMKKNRQLADILVGLSVVIFFLAISTVVILR